jgi:hypothetical protein
MFGKLFESITTITGSKRTDAQMEARRISRRCTIAFNISGEAAFATMASQADEIEKVLDDPKFEPVYTAIEKLKTLGNELQYIESSKGLREQISDAYRAGTRMKASGNNGSSDSDWREIVRLVLIAGDSEHKLWSDDEVLAAKSRFGIKGPPSYEALIHHLGKEKVELACEELIKERIAGIQFKNELQGNKSPCHECGGTDDLTFHAFALARVLKKERDWKLSGAAAVISAVTLPSLGIGYLRGPESSQSANVLRMRLVLCHSCVNKRMEKGKLGSTENNCSLHPWWVRAHEAGFDKFIPESEMNTWQ